jgi:rhodanese-related sulfurtransferase
MADDDPLIPPIGAISQAERLFRVNWVTTIVRSPSGIPMLPAEFVSRLGRSVRIVDLRRPDELVGPLGHIPGSDWVPLEVAATLSNRVHRDAPVVLISRGGERAGAVAKLLEAAGMRMVASLEGGIVSWKNLGFTTSRSATILDHKDQLCELEPSLPPDTELTVDAIERHVGDPQSVRFLKLAALMLHGRMSCVDGRDDSGVVGTLGGDAGEFLLLLAAIERVAGKTFSAAEVKALFARRLDALGRFYIHSDISSANAFIASMRSDSRLDKVLADINETMEWRAFFLSPPPAVREIVLEHLARPEHLGCGHVRLMWKDPERYGVRSELVSTFIRAFMQARWEGATDAEFVPLPGGHAEKAVLRVFVEGELQPFTPIPLVSPSYRGVQMFVCHPQVVSYLRRQLVAFALQYRALVPAVSAEAVLAEIDRLAGAQMDATLGALAKGLPIFDVRHSPGFWEVEQAGVVT